MVVEELEDALFLSPDQLPESLLRGTFKCSGMLIPSCGAEPVLKLLVS